MIPDRMTFNNKETNVGKKNSKKSEAKSEATEVAIDRGADGHAEENPERETVEQGTVRPFGEDLPRDEDSNEMSDSEKVELDASMIRVRVSVNVNGHKAGDELVVAHDHPFYAALVSQQLAEVIG